MPSRDANGNWVYSQAEYEHLNFTGEPFSGFVEGIGYTCTETIITSTVMNKSKTHSLNIIQKLQLEFKLPNLGGVNNFLAPVNKNSLSPKNEIRIKSNEASDQSQSIDKIKSIKEKISSFLMNLALAQTKSDAATGAILLGGTEAIANKAIPHSWVESPETSALVTDLIVTSEFFTGTGPESRLFGSEMASTKSLMNSHLTHVAYNDYLNLPESTIQTNPTISLGFNPLESHGSGPFIEGAYDYYNSSPHAKDRSLSYNTAQFVGSSKYQFTIDGDSIEVTVTNTTNIRSAFYHIPGLGKPKRSEAPLGILGTVNQTYKYKISKEDLKKKANESLSNLVKKDRNRNR